MQDKNRLEELLDRYEDLLDEGRTPSVDDLCGDDSSLRAELVRRIHRLHRVSELLGDPPPPPGPDSPLLSLSDDKTWVTQPAREPWPVEIPAPPGYEVLAPLGEGGMGIVYKARQVGLNRLVALKMILAGSRARAIDLVRFRDEAQSIAALRHPNIVQVFEIGEFRGQPFFSLEFCAGGALSKALKGEPQPPRTAAAMAEVLARAVHYAHSRGIVHRDLKPGNVLVNADLASPDGESSTIDSERPFEGDSQSALLAPHTALKITDFGLAKRVDDASDKTQDGSVIGTPSYMAPEQALGHTKEIGPLTDIHALGAMLYEFLTGRPPFKGSTVHETLEQVRYRDPVPVRELQPKAPIDLETICLKCLEKDPKKRYQSADALAEDLDRFLGGRPIKARPVTRAVRLWRWCRREPRTAVQAAVTAFLCIVIPTLVVAYSMRLRSAEALLAEREHSLVAARNAERAAQEMAQTNQYYAALNEAGRLRTTARPGWTWEARKRVEEAAATDCPASNPVALRGELAATLGEIDVRPIGIVAEGMQAGEIAFFPDGRVAIAPQLMMLLNPFLNVLVIDPRTKAQQRLPLPAALPGGGKMAGASTALAVSPDGRWLALGLRGGNALCWDMRAKPDPVRREWTAHDQDVSALAFTPDGKGLITGSGDGTVKRWNTGDPDKPEAVWRSKATPDEKVKGLAYWEGTRSGILVHSAAAAHFLDPLTLAEVDGADPGDWVPPTLAGYWKTRLAVHSPTGTIVTTAGSEMTMTYWDRNICMRACNFVDRRLVEEGMAHADAIESIAIHPSGMLLASACADDGIVKVWHLGSGELAIAIPASNATAVAFSPDGKLLAVGGSNATTLYEIGGLRAQTFVARRGLVIRAMGFTADGALGTVASRRNPQHRDRECAVASVWNEDGQLAETVLRRLDTPAAKGRERVAASAAGRWTAFVTGDGTVTWRGPPGGSSVSVERAPTTGFLDDLSIDPTGQCWTIEDERRLNVRQAAAKRKPRRVPVGWPWTGRQGLACVRAGAEHVLVGCENGFLRVLSPSGALTRDCPCFDESTTSLITESANTVHAVDILADESRAIAGTEDGRLWLFGLPSGAKLAAWNAHSDRVTAVAFDPTGKLLASGGRDQKVRLWQRAGDRYEPYVTLAMNHSSAVRQLLFSADGRRLFVLREKEMAIRVWHLDQLDEAFRAVKLGQ